MQTLNTNVYDASRNSRSFGGNIVGLVGNFSLNGTIDRNEYFYGATNSAISGLWPRVTLSRNERPLFGSAAYFSLVGDYSNLVRENTGDDGITTTSRSPASRWCRRSAIRSRSGNGSPSIRRSAGATPIYTRSLAPGTTDVIDEGAEPAFFEFQTRLVGPGDRRVWNTPDNGYAEKFKHSVEPFLHHRSHHVNRQLRSHHPARWQRLDRRRARRATPTASTTASTRNSAAREPRSARREKSPRSM